MARWISFGVWAALALVTVLACVGCCMGGGTGAAACASRQACCDAIEAAPSNPTVAYIRGTCRVQVSGASCTRSLGNIHDRIARSPTDTVPQVCMP